MNLLVIQFFLLIYSDEVDILYKNGLRETDRGNFNKSNEYLLKAYTQKQHSKIAFWIAYNYSHLDSTEKCLQFIIKAETIPPQPLTGNTLETIEELKKWAKQRDYRTYVKYKVTLSDEKLPVDERQDKIDSSENELRVKRIYFQNITPPTLQIKRRTLKL